MNQRRSAPGNEAGKSADHGNVEAIGAPGCPFCCPPLAQACVTCLHVVRRVTGHHLMLPVLCCLHHSLSCQRTTKAQPEMPCLAGPITADHELLTGRTLPLLLAAHPKI